MEDIKNHFIKGLAQMRNEIESYSNEANIWKVAGSMANTPGVLVMHVCGNLKYTIGATLGKNGFIRNRDAEFATKGLTREALLTEIDGTVKMIEPFLANLSADIFNDPWPDAKWAEGETIAAGLIRIGIHLGYHLGQINYHRRLVDK